MKTLFYVYVDNGRMRNIDAILQGLEERHIAGTAASRRFFKGSGQTIDYGARLKWAIFSTIVFHPTIRAATKTGESNNQQ